MFAGDATSTAGIRNSDRDAGDATSTAGVSNRDGDAPGTAGWRAEPRPQRLRREAPWKAGARCLGPGRDPGW